MKVYLRLLLLPLSVWTAATALCANWPAWRGPEASGVSPEHDLPLTWSESKNIRWKTPLPDRGNSTPIVWGDRVFITQAIEADGRRTLMSFDRANGKLLWQTGLTYKEKDVTHEANPLCSASPVTDGERVVAYFGSAGVYCYDFAGKEVWRRELGKQQHEWGYAASPVLNRGLCFVYHGPGPGAQLLALDSKTGQTVWKFEEPPPITAQRTDGFKGKEPGYVGTWSTPIIIKSGEREELIMSFPNRLVAFDPTTGKQLWVCDGLNPLVYASPIYGEGLVVSMGGFFGSGIGVKPGGSGDVTGTARVWREERAKKNRCGSGVIAGGRIFLVNMEGFVECVDLKTGSQLWEERLPRQHAKGESWASTLLAGDRIYAVNQSGEVTVFKAGPKFEVVSVNSIGDELTNASLVPSGGELFLRTHKHLWCISGAKTVAAAD